MTLLFTVLLTFLAFPDSISISDSDQDSQHRIVLSLSDNGFIPAQQQFSIADELNITLFEVSDPRHIRSFPDSRYDFLLSIGPDYEVPGVLSHSIPTVVENIVQQYQRFELEIPDRIAAVSILRYPYESSPDYIRTAQTLSDTLSAVISVPFYLQSSGLSADIRPEGVNFISERVSAGQSHNISRSVVHFIPSNNLRETYSTLNHTMDSLLQFDESILILPASWFFSEIESRNELRYLFRNHVAGESVRLPLPASTAETPVINWSIILLLLIWGSFALHFRYQPIYSQSVIRYFTNHSFFVDDVMEHRLRNVLPGFYLLIQHALLTGLFVYASAEVVLTKQGLNVLGHHFPALMIFGNSLLSLFVSGIIAAIILQGVSVIWIYFANRELTAFSQILNLYSWPLHLNLLVVTCLIVFNQVGFSKYLILIFGAVFILIWFFSFNITAIDSSKFLTTGTAKIIFLVLTAGIHILLILGILIYILYTPSLLEPLLFAVEIP